MFTIIIFIIIFAVLVLVHEWGHFYAAKRQGIAVEEFGLGFPPKLASYLWRGTLYTLNAIPLGGFVRIKGEFGENADDGDSFSGRPVWQRLIVVVAGIVMNIFLGWVLLTIVFLSGFPQVIDPSIPEDRIRDRQVYVMHARPDSPASLAGIEGGDEILAVGGVSALTVSNIQQLLSEQGSTPLDVQLLRGEDTVDVIVTPEYFESIDRVAMGVELQEVGVISYSPIDAVVRGAVVTGVILREIVVSLANILQNLFIHQRFEAEFTGPIGIAVLTGKMAERGIAHLLQFAALLSLNLAVLNALPIPALDGGRFLFLCVEAIRRKPLSERIESVIHRGGFALLILLILVVTYKDILKFFVK